MPWVLGQSWPNPIDWRLLWWQTHTHTCCSKTGQTAVITFRYQSQYPITWLVPFIPFPSIFPYLFLPKPPGSSPFPIFTFSPKYPITSIPYETHSSVGNSPPQSAGWPRVSGSSKGWLLSWGWGTECGNMSGASPARAYPSTSEAGKQDGESKSQRKPSDHLQQRRANKPGPTKTPVHQASSWRCGGLKVKTGPQFVGHSQDQADPSWR